MNKKVVFFVIAFIFSVISSMLGLGYLVTLILGLPFDIVFPLSVRLLGFFVIAVGVGFAGWTLRYRNPYDIMESSYATVRKAIKRIQVAEKIGRSESLVILGPYKYVRHPQYFGVGMLLLGLGLLLGFTFLFFGSLFLFYGLGLFLFLLKKRNFWHSLEFSIGIILRKSQAFSLL